MQLGIILSILMTSCSYETKLDPPFYDEFNSKKHPNKKFEAVIDHYKDMALESELRAYELIKLISTGKGTVGDLSFNGVGSLGTYEEHDKAFKLLQEIGCRFGSGFYIPYGPNYDFVRTAVNVGSLNKWFEENKGVIKKYIKINNMVKVLSDKRVGPLNEIKKSHSKTWAQTNFNKAMSVDNDDEIQNADLGKKIIKKSPTTINNSDLNKAFINVVGINRYGCLRSPDFAVWVIKKMPNAISAKNINTALSNALEFDKDGNLIGPVFARWIIENKGTIIDKNTINTAFINSIKVDKTGFLTNEYIARLILEKFPKDLSVDKFKDLLDKIIKLGNLDYAYLVTMILELFGDDTIEKIISDLFVKSINSKNFKFADLFAAYKRKGQFIITYKKLKGYKDLNLENEYLVNLFR